MCFTMPRLLTFLFFSGVTVKRFSTYSDRVLKVENFKILGMFDVQQLHLVYIPVPPHKIVLRDKQMFRLT